MHTFTKTKDRKRLFRCSILVILMAGLTTGIFMPFTGSGENSQGTLPEKSPDLLSLLTAASGPSSVTGSATNIRLDGTSQGINTGSVTEGSWLGSINNYYLASSATRIGIPPQPGDWEIQQADVAITGLQDRADLLQWPTGNAWDTQAENYEYLPQSSYGGTYPNSISVDGFPETDALEGYWKLDGNGQDSSGGGHTLSISGATYTTGKVGQALNFDGVNDQSYASFTAPTNNFAFGAWFRADQTHEIDPESNSGTVGTVGQRYAFGAAHGGDTAAGAGLSIGTNGLSVYEHGSGYMPALAVYSATIGTGWNHVMVVYINRQPSIYLNGILVHTGVTSARATVNAPYQFGYGSYGYHDGRLDEIRVYNRALTSGEVETIYRDALGTRSLFGNVGSWTMDEAFGSTAYDYSGQNNDGAIQGSLTWTTGQVGNALQFDGNSANYVRVGNPASLQITGSQTISMWLYPTSFASRRNPYEKAYGGEGTITQETDGDLNYFYGTNGGNGSPYQGFRTNTPIPINTWTHICIVRDLDDMQLRWYINGNLDRAGAASYAAATAGSRNVQIGLGYAGSYAGRIDEVQVFDRALSAGEVTELHDLNDQYATFNLNHKTTATQQLLGDSDFNFPDGPFTGDWKMGSPVGWEGTVDWTTASPLESWAIRQGRVGDTAARCEGGDSYLWNSANDATRSGRTYSGTQMTQTEYDGRGWNYYSGNPGSQGSPYQISDSLTYPTYGGWHSEFRSRVDTFSFAEDTGSEPHCKREASAKAAGSVTYQTQTYQTVTKSFASTYVTSANLRAKLDLTTSTTQLFLHGTTNSGDGTYDSHLFGGKFYVEGRFTLVNPSNLITDSQWYTLEIGNHYSTGSGTWGSGGTLYIGGVNGWDVQSLINTYSGTGTTWTVKISLRVTLEVDAYGYKRVQQASVSGDAWARAMQSRTAHVTLDWAEFNVRESVNYDQDSTTGAVVTGATRDNRGRVLSTAQLPYFTLEYGLASGLDNPNHETTGIYPAIFLKRDGQANWERIIYNSTYSLSQLRLDFGNSGNLWITMSAADRTWFNTANGGNPLQQYQVGVGLFVPVGSGGRRIVYLGADYYPISLGNVKWQTRGIPCPGIIGLTLEDTVTSRVTLSPAGPVYTPDGTGSATIVDTGTQFNPLQTGDSHYLDFVFRSETLATFSWTLTMTMLIDGKAIPVIYTAMNGSTVSYAATSVPVTAPVAEDYFTTNYRSTAEVEFTIPRWFDDPAHGGTGECYWNLTNFRVNQNSPWVTGLEITGPTDPVWLNFQDSYVGVYENASTTVGNEYQQLLLTSGLWASETEWSISLNFWSPNDVTSVDLSRNSGFATADTAFVAGQDNCYANATFRTGASEFGTYAVAAEWFNNEDDRVHGAYRASIGSNTVTFVGDSWQTDGLHGQGSGFVTAINVNKTVTTAMFSGIIRVGFRSREFALTKPTQASVQVLIDGAPGDIYDPNDQTSPMMTIQVTWNDVSDIGSPVPIAYDDGIMDPDNPAQALSLQSRIVIAEWKLTTGDTPRKYADVYSRNGWRGWGVNYPTEIVGTEMIGENWRRSAQGIFEADVSPLSVYNTGGNMTQGYHNFTIELRRKGFENKTISGEFNIMVDTFMVIVDPSHNDGQELVPHSVDENVEALKNITIDVQLRTRAAGEQDLISNGTLSNAYGKVHVNYTLIKIGHDDPLLDVGPVNGGELYWDYSTSSWSPEANWSLVNTSYIAQDPFGLKNYHNGSLTHRAVDEPFTYTMRVQAPGYADNAAGYGSNVGPGNPSYDADDGSGRGVEKYLYYNFTYWIETNATYEPFADGTVDNSFQPNIYTSASKYQIDNQYINGTCERPNAYGNSEFVGDADYDGVYDDPGDLTFEGRKVEEWARVLLHRENTGNVTNLVLINASKYIIDFQTHLLSENTVSIANMSDSGWIFNMTQVSHEGELLRAIFDDRLHTDFDPADPPEAYYTALQYWRNLTEYAEFDPGTPQLIRFRVLYNCTWNNFWDTWKNNGTGASGPLGGPIPADDPWGFSGPTQVYLRNWNSSGNIPLINDGIKYVMEVANYSGGDPIQVVGDTWVTPWLNLTEHMAAFLSGLPGDPAPLEISAQKIGFYESSLQIKLDILPQRTILVNETTGPGDGTVIVDEQGNNVGGDFVLSTPHGIPLSFQVNYTDVTNDNDDVVLALRREGITGATIEIPEWFNDDTPGSRFYYDNLGTDYWIYEETTPGIYNITFKTTDFLDLTTDRTFNFTFEISKGNYTTRQFDVHLTITLRDLMINILNSSVLQGLYSDPTKYPLARLNNPLYQEMNFTFEILDKDGDYTPINLTTYLTGQDTLDKYFDFGTLVSSTMIQNDSIAGRPRYHVAIYTGIAVGWHELTIDLLNIPNFASYSNNSYSFQVLPVNTEIYFPNAGIQSIYYIAPNTGSTDLFPKFEFEVIDVNHTDRWDPWINNNDSISTITQAQVSIPGWTAQWSFALKVSNNYETAGIIWWKRIYEITLNTTGMPASVNLLEYQFTVTKANHESATGYCRFYINPAPTEFYNLKLNDQNIYHDGEVLYAADPIIIPWNQDLNLSFGWGYIDLTGQARNLTDDVTAPVSITLPGWNYAYNESWQSNGAEATYGKYYVMLKTNFDVASLPYDVAFSLTITKENFETKVYSFNFRIRARYTDLKIVRDIEKGFFTTQTNWRIAYGEKFSLGFELLDAEVDTPLITAVTSPSLVDYGTNKLSINGHVSGPDFTWTQTDIELRASLSFEHKTEVDGTHYYYNLTFIDTTELMVLRDVENPDELLPHAFQFTIALKNYVAHTLDINLTVTPKEVTFGISGSIKLEDTFINVAEIDSFELYITITNPDTGLPFQADLFTVTYKFMSFNLTLGQYLEATFENAEGSLKWNPETFRYEVEILINEEMNGVFRVYFTITSKSGNYVLDEEIQSFEDIVFQNPPPRVDPLSYILVAISLMIMAGVGGYVTRKLFLMRIPFVLRMIDESIEKIQKDKYPPVGVMTGRREFVVNTVIEELATVGIKWEMAKKAIAEEEEETVGTEKELPALKMDEINKRLDEIPGLSSEEKMLFVEELVRLGRTEQEEFLNSLKQEETKA